MKILFGADAIRFPLTGIGRYAFELGRRLGGLSGVGDVQFLVGNQVGPGLPVASGGPGLPKAIMAIRRHAIGNPLVGAAHRVIASMQQRRALGVWKDYLYHGPNYYLPRHAGSCVATFHDLSIYKWPDCHPSWRVRHMQRELPRALKRAQVLITDSEFSRLELAAHFSVPLGRIVAVPLAASDVYRPHTQLEVAPVLQRWHLAFGRYVLFVGTLDPRKNIDTLLDAFERLPLATRRGCPLVVAGFEGWKSEHTLARLRRAEREGWGRYLGFVSEDELPLLYAGARVFAFPSRYEGFGLPVLEAMASGVPVICSNATCLPEVAATAAAMCDPDDVDALSLLLEQALDDGAWIDDLRARGLARSAQFSWDTTAQATLGAYRLARGV